MQINALMSAYSLYAPASLGATSRPAPTASIENTGKARPATPAITDTVSFSSEATAQLDGLATGRDSAGIDAVNTGSRFINALTQTTQRPGGPPPSPRSAISASATDSSESASGADSELSPEEVKQVDQLAARDREVRQHEQAHLTAAGPYARGGPTYSYQSGPDGKQYAIGGQVSIDTSPVEGDPEATAHKARIVRAAALAPAEPSSQDLKVAANATKLEQEALAEIRQNSAPAGQTGSASSPAEADAPAARQNATPQRYGVSTPDQPRFLNVVA